MPDSYFLLWVWLCNPVLASTLDGRISWGLLRRVSLCRKRMQSRQATLLPFNVVVRERGVLGVWHHRAAAVALGVLLQTLPWCEVTDTCSYVRCFKLGFCFCCWKHPETLLLMQYFSLSLIYSENCSFHPEEHLKSIDKRGYYKVPWPFLVSNMPKMFSSKFIGENVF